MHPNAPGIGARCGHAYDLVRLMSAQSTPPEEIKHKVEKYLRTCSRLTMNMLVGDFKETGCRRCSRPASVTRETRKRRCGQQGRQVSGSGRTDDMNKDPLAKPACLTLRTRQLAWRTPRSP
jgi:hypothetical protein